MSVIVDAHLDIAWNALNNARDLTMPLSEIRAAEIGAPAVAMTSLPELGKAGVGIVFATLYAEPATQWAGSCLPSLGREPRCYETADEAHEIALEMLELYEAWAEAGQIRMITDRERLERHLEMFGQDRTPGFVISLEGADPIVSPDDLPWWFARGLRIVSLAWGSTRYAGGTGSSAPLTDLGRELLGAMAEVGIAHDASHLSEEAFWEAIGMPHHGLCVTHATARALMRPPPGHRIDVPLNRFLSDAQILEISRPHGVTSRGVIGLALLNDFLEPRWRFDDAGRRNEVSLRSQGAAHLHHLAAVAGWESVGLGSDIDAGYGRDESPVELDSVTDWCLVADHVPTPVRRAVLGDNWLRFLREVLPARTVP